MPKRPTPHALRLPTRRSAPPSADSSDPEEADFPEKFQCRSQKGTLLRPNHLHVSVDSTGADDAGSDPADSEEDLPMESEIPTAAFPISAPPPPVMQATDNVPPVVPGREESGKSFVNPLFSAEPVQTQAPLLDLNIAAQPERGPPPVWADLLRQREKQSTTNAAPTPPLVPPLGGKGEVCFSPDECLRMARECSGMLYGRILGRPIPLPVVRSALPRIWKTEGKVSIVDLAEGYYCISFDKLDERDRILSSGPWTVRGQVLALQHWSPLFQPGRSKISVFPLWVQLPRLPFELLSEYSLLKIGRALGEVVRIDSRSLSRDRAQFARICVLINCEQPLLPSIRLRFQDTSISQPVSYESLPDVCFTCGRAGHRKDVCPYGATPPADPPADLPQTTTKSGSGAPGPALGSTTTTSPESDEVYGPWIQVQRRRRPSRPQQAPPAPTQPRPSPTTGGKQPGQRPVTPPNRRLIH